MVYPRACGGADSASIKYFAYMGLSPRVRGSLQSESIDLAEEGSIPARAGEPVEKAAGAGQGGVYPRACGGAQAQ